MKITVLSENTSLSDDIDAEHGLSLWIETEKHKIIYDMGQSDVFARNAKVLGVDLSQADIAVISHGHYDHGGGLKHFLEVNNKADIYISRRAFGEYYNGSEKYIGLDKALADCERLVFTDDKLEIDDELSLCSYNDAELIHPIETFGLNKKEDGHFYAEDFLHEQYLVINENGRKTVISGCSHKGILNIVNLSEPDVFVGGFHFMKLDPFSADREKLSEIAEEMLKYKTEYYTCHCTGTEQFEYLRLIMENRVRYISGGAIIEI